MGSDEVWNTATQALHNALRAYGHPYKVKEGEGAFYGPKIEIVIKDAMNREWQCGTIQVDFFQAGNFDLGYVTSLGLSERPVIIHGHLWLLRAILYYLMNITKVICLCGSLLCR